MNRLIATVMLATLAAIVVEIAARRAARPGSRWSRSRSPRRRSGSPARGSCPRAVRLGARSDSTERQSSLAVEIFRGHVLCAVLIAALLVLQLSFA